MIKKGSVVEVCATVCTSYDNLDMFSSYDLEHEPAVGGRVGRIKRLFRAPTEGWEGLVIGYTYLATGGLKRELEDEFGGTYYQWYLQEDKRHRVFRVVPLDSDRFLKSVCVLESDLSWVSGSLR